MLKGLIVFALAVASWAQLLGWPMVGATPVDQQTQQRDHRLNPGSETASLKDGMQWPLVSNSSLRPKRESSGVFVFPTKEVEDFLNNIRGEKHSGDSIVFPGPSGRPFIPSSEFGYGEEDGPKTWPKTYPFCGGIRQSPIDIDLALAKLPPSGSDGALSFKYYDAQPTLLTVTNSGHSLRMIGNWNAERRPRVSGLVLPGEYALAEVHFHWGANDNEGSEHLVQGHRFPLEMHVVNYKMEYGSFNESLKKKDGLAVVSHLFKVQGHNNPGLQKVLTAAKELINPDSPAVSIEPFTLDKLAPPFTRKYASYFGSLTTPPCSEIVTWIVNLKPHHVSSEQLQKLRELRRNDGTRMLFNFRPVQSLNHRGIVNVP